MFRLERGACVPRGLDTFNTTSPASCCHLSLNLFKFSDFEEAAALCSSALRGTSCTDVAALSSVAALLGRKEMSDAVQTT